VSRGSAARAGAGAAGIVLLLALFAGVNYVGARHWVRGDWTKTRLFSLSQTTRKVLTGLTKPVQVTVFMTRNSRLYQPVSELLSRYRAVSPRVEVEFLDPERNPLRAEALVKQFGIRQNTVVFRSGESKKYVEEDKLADFDFSGAQMGAAPQIRSFKGEEAFTSAILDVTEKNVSKIYFSSGHGEPKIDSQERGRGFAQAKQLLERENLSVATWDSLGKGSIPADAAVVVVAGPRAAFLEPEAAALKSYAEGGGRILLMLDPVLPQAGAPESDLGIGSFLAAYGLKLGADIVIDPANAVPMVGPETLIANSYGSHPIVRSLSEEGLPVVFPLARSISKPDKPPEGYTETMLAQTSKDGWGETSLTKLEAVQKDKDDTQGPVTIAVAVEAEKKDKDPKAPSKPFRLVVIGNSRFATNGSLGNAGNANLLLNAVNWLSGQERLVGIAPKTPEQASLALTRTQVNRIGLFTILGLPAFAIVLGIWVWYRRRD
jgi:gliding motility-associatede transport system auxiliary component